MSKLYLLKNLSGRISEKLKRRKQNIKHYIEAISLKSSPCLGLALAILLFFALLKLRLNYIYSDAWAAFSVKLDLRCLLNIAAYLLIQMYCCLLSGTAFQELPKQLFKNKFVNYTIDFFSCLFLYPFGILFLVYYGIKKRRWGSVLMFVATFVLFAFAFLHDDNPNHLMSSVINSALPLEVFLTITGLLALMEEHKHWKLEGAVWILSIFFGIIYLLCAKTPRLQYYEAEAKMLNALDGTGIIEHVEKGLGYDCTQEPLASLIETASKTKNLDLWKKYRNHFTTEEYKAFYNDLSAAELDFKEKTLAFLREMPQPKAFEKEKLGETRLDIDAVRKAAHYLSLEMMAFPSNKSLVEQNNEHLIKIREWLSRGSFQDYKSNTFVVEQIRLNALARIMPKMHCTLEECQKLLGNEQDWRSILASYYFSYYGCYSYLYYSVGGLKRYFQKPFERFFYKCFDNGICFWEYSNPMRYFFISSEIYRIKMYTRLFQVVLDEHTDYKTFKEIKDNNSKVIKKHYPLVLDTISNWDFKRIAAIENMRKMAIIAWHITKYMDSHNGEMPETLSALGDMPTDSLDSKPFKYEHGSLEFYEGIDEEPIVKHGFVLFSQTDREDNPTDEWYNSFLQCIVILE